ncbi:hypothetical protein O181_035581 [Austropuccinia psidii MF-1]|uniref:Peroxin-14 n=1 Tax=Austropuccinia psidii MF-1 TaxID=1389203 RepID=A0A9Q3H931_9BASI|nr:hypothetical protein [Austropuccinia psidii MF-1]
MASSKLDPSGSAPQSSDHHHPQSNHSNPAMETSKSSSPPKSIGQLSRSQANLDKTIQSGNQDSDPSKNQVDQSPRQPQSSIGKTSDEQLPPLPPKNFNYPQIQFITQNKPSSNQVLINFLLNISNGLFFGGCLTGLIIFIYQKHFFPKLQIKTEILTKFISSASTSFEKFVENLISLAQINPQFYKTATTLASLDLKEPPKTDLVDDDQMDEHNSANNLSESIEDKSSMGEDETSSKRPSTSSSQISNFSQINNCNKTLDSSDHINKPILDSLNRLTSILRKRQSHLTQNSAQDGTPKLRPAVHLIETLKKVQGDIYSENSGYLNPQSRTNLAYNFTKLPYSDLDNPTALIENKKALSQFKDGIRSIKGMLLNRRNFSSWRTTGPVNTT